MPSCTKPAWLHADRRQTKVISSGCTPSSHICSKYVRASLSCPCVANPPSMEFQETTSRNGISLNTLLASSMLPHFAYMSTKLFPINTSESHPLWMICSWAHLPSSSATKLAHAFTTPTKVTESGFTPSCCICENSSSAFCPCAHFPCHNIMAFQVTPSRDGILFNTLWASSIMPHLAYISTRLHPTKASPSQPLWIICSWTCLPSSSARKLAHALSTGKKVNLLGIMPFFLHFLEKRNRLLMLPSLTVPCKPPIPREPIQLHSPWCHGGQFCIHPRGIPSVPNPEWILRHLRLEIRVSCSRVLRPAIPPLRRIWKELPPQCLDSLARCCWFTLPPQFLAPLFYCRKSLHVLTDTTRQWVDGALPSPRRFIEATEIEGLGIPGYPNSGTNLTSTNRGRLSRNVCFLVSLYGEADTRCRLRSSGARYLA